MFLVSLFFLCTVGHTSETHSVHVYTLNGRHLASADIQHRVTGNFINKEFKNDIFTAFFKMLIKKHKMGARGLRLLDK